MSEKEASFDLYRKENYIMCSKNFDTTWPDEFF